MSYVFFSSNFFLEFKEFYNETLLPADSLRSCEKQC